MANLIMRFPGGKPKTLTLSYDDGVEQDVRLIEIAKKYGLKGTFNINSGCFPSENVYYAPGTIHRRMPKSRVLDTYRECGWEIAAHAYTHASLVGLPANICAKEILKDRAKLEELFGTIVRGFAYPYGAYDDKCVDTLKACGICYSRTVEATHDFHLPNDWLRLKATCHHKDPALMELTKRFVETKDWWDPMFFYLWGHSYEFEADDNWDLIEEFGALAGGRDDIWYATNIEIYDYCHAFSELLFNTEMNKCINPTVYEIWFAYDGKEVFVPAGGTVTF